MKRALPFLLAAACIAAHAQETPGPYGEQHAEEKRLEQVAIGLRVQQNLRIANTRRKAQYAENRRRCEAALLVAAQCGKFAGTFYCDDKGFKPIAAEDSVKPAVIGNGARRKMERCALDAARRNP